MRKHSYYSVLFGVAFTGYASWTYCKGIVGLWDTVDDRTGEKKALVRLLRINHQIQGRIIKVYWKPHDHHYCLHCKGKLKNQPIVGLKFLWGLQEKSPYYWTDGSILDPHNGMVYRVNIKQQGQQLFVRAYWGFSALGRTQVWYKHDEDKT